MVRTIAIAEARPILLNLNAVSIVFITKVDDPLPPPSLCTEFQKR